MKLAQWIKLVGGASAAARLLGVTRQCVGHWMNHRSLPSAAVILRIIKVSRGAVQPLDIIRIKNRKTK